MIRLLKLLPFALLIACTSPSTSTTGQMISCTVSKGVVSNCHPMTAADKMGAPGTCQDIDEDGDGKPGDVNEEDGSGSGSGSGHADASDKDGDGTPDSMDTDDDNDGIPDVNDCDNEPGGDNPAGGAHD